MDIFYHINIKNNLYDFKWARYRWIWVNINGIWVHTVDLGGFGFFVPPVLASIRNLLIDIITAACTNVYPITKHPERLILPKLI